VLGADLATPILVAPTAMHRFACPDGELATARGAADAGTVMVVSMASTTSVEDVAAAAPDAPRWVQCYLLRDRARTRALVERARDSGYEAIVLCVDGAGVAHPAPATAGSLELPPSFEFPNLSRGDLPSMLHDFDPAVVFDDIDTIAEWGGGLPVIVKGVLRGVDARRCMDAGAAAVIVSNHGGRTLDGMIATARALPEVLEKVDGAGEVYVDGGIRSGTDVVRALALGARAVFVGRPVLWGLAIGGADGAIGVLEALRADLVRAMAFCGAASLDDLSPDLLA
jgi:4-hydroxymandelate oxidase